MARAAWVLGVLLMVSPGCAQSRAPVLQKLFVDSGAPDEITRLITLIEALPPRNFDRALLDRPRGSRRPRLSAG
ncbi:hypothetical protein [Nannocystis punicea]|uniref:Uncharacterized protein n=1 Tax=Nannocystis punicea TaxID=2995304 RepID=A0ABY7HI02_9BACT|nr:hypothetical protein [Nannocystis poenicansa]WAS98584.1 hypothetical protein O0S08_20795 [Nannocystis poenicansa]